MRSWLEKMIQAQLKFLFPLRDTFDKAHHLLHGSLHRPVESMKSGHLLLDPSRPSDEL